MLFKQFIITTVSSPSPAGQVTAARGRLFQNGLLPVTRCSRAYCGLLPVTRCSRAYYGLLPVTRCSRAYYGLLPVTRCSRAYYGPQRSLPLQAVRQLGKPKAKDILGSPLSMSRLLKLVSAQARPVASSLLRHSVPALQIRSFAAAKDEVVPVEGIVSSYSLIAL